jgi:hypothetical protein
MNTTLLEMKLSTEVSGFKVEIKLQSIDDLENAYLVLLDAKSRLHELERKHRVRLIADRCKDKTKEYWAKSEDKKVVQGVDDAPIGMMISLLEVFPQTKKGSVVASEVGISQPAVSRYFTGSLGEHSEYFEEVEDGWRISEKGVLFLADWLGVNVNN